MLALVLGTPAALACQGTPLAVGSQAPDFSLVQATAEGVSESPFRLGDYRDQTVVIAFFYRARTSG
jgi:peroxiredoxin